MEATAGDRGGGGGGWKGNRGKGYGDWKEKKGYGEWKEKKGWGEWKDKKGWGEWKDNKWYGKGYGDWKEKTGKGKGGGGKKGHVKDEGDGDQHGFRPLDRESASSRGGHYVEGGFVDAEGVFRPFFGCKMCCTVRIHAALNSFQLLPILFNPFVNVHIENAVPSCVFGLNSFTIEMHCLHLCSNYHTLFPSRWYLASHGANPETL